MVSERMSKTFFNFRDFTYLHDITLRPFLSLMFSAALSLEMQIALESILLTDDLAFDSIRFYSEKVT